MTDSKSEPEERGADLDATTLADIDSSLEMYSGDPHAYEELRKMIDELAPQMRAFVIKWLEDPTNITAAAVRAWPHVKRSTAAVRGCQLLRLPKIQRVVAFAMNQRADRTLVNVDRVVHEQAIIGFSSIRDYKVDPLSGRVEPAPGMPEYVMRAVKSVKHRVTVETTKDGDVLTTKHDVELQLWNKNDSLRFLGEHLGMLVKRVGGPNGEPLVPTAAIENVRDIIKDVVGRRKG